MTRPRAVIAWLLVLVSVVRLVAPANLTAQVVVGRVVDASSGPVAMVHVTPMLGANALGSGVLTDANGRFHLAVAGQRPTSLAVRRIGFLREAPRALEWGTRERIEVIIVLRAVPLALPTVTVAATGCATLDALEPESSAGILIDAATSTIAARAAFESQYSYRVRSTGHRFGAGRTIPHDTTYDVRPPALRIDTAAAMRPLMAYRRAGLFRQATYNAWSPDVRLLMTPSFLRRFCLVDVDRAADGRVALAARLNSTANAATTVTMRVRFDSLAAGPSTIVFEYFIDARLVTRAESHFSLFEVEGHRFPLGSQSSMTFINPRSGKPVNEALARSSYSDFARVAP